MIRPFKLATQLLQGPFTQPSESLCSVMSRLYDTPCFKPSACKMLHFCRPNPERNPTLRRPESQHPSARQVKAYALVYPDGRASLLLNLPIGNPNTRCSVTSFSRHLPFFLHGCKLADYSCNSFQLAGPFIVTT